MTVQISNISLPASSVKIKLASEAGADNYIGSTSTNTLTLKGTQTYTFSGAPVASPTGVVGVKPGDTITLEGAGVMDGDSFTIASASGGVLTVQGALVVDGIEYLFTITRKLQPLVRGFTTFGRMFLAAIATWKTIGASDEYHLDERVKFIGLGSGRHAEPLLADSMASPEFVSGVNYLQELDLPSEYFGAASMRMRFTSPELKDHLLSEVGLMTGKDPVELSGASASITAIDTSYAVVTGLSDALEYHSSKYLNLPDSAEYPGKHKIVEVLSDTSVVISGDWPSGEVGRAWSIETPVEESDCGPVLYREFDPIAVLSPFRLSIEWLLE